MVDMSPRQMVAAVAKVRSLECGLRDGEKEQCPGGDAAEGVVAEINELRHALGWLEIDADGQWRWPGVISLSS